MRRFFLIAVTAFACVLPTTLLAEVISSGVLVNRQGHAIGAYVIVRDVGNYADTAEEANAEFKEIAEEMGVTNTYVGPTTVGNGTILYIEGFR